MSRILLADDSAHAQRMGERILREEGYEVVTVTDGQTALVRLSDVDPDLVFADVSLPGRTGYEICRQIKAHPRFKHVRVILTAGMLEAFDEQQASAVGCDGILKKPFEASAVLEMVKPLTTAAQASRPNAPLSADEAIIDDEAPLELRRFPAVPVRVLPDFDLLPSGDAVDPERVRAAVILALDAALPAVIDEITEKLLISLRQ